MRSVPGLHPHSFGESPSNCQTALGERPNSFVRYVAPACSQALLILSLDPALYMMKLINTKNAKNNNFKIIFPPVLIEPVDKLSNHLIPVKKTSQQIAMFLFYAFPSVFPPSPHSTGHSSPVCNAFNTRIVSVTDRPTDPELTSA